MLPAAYVSVLHIDRFSALGRAASRRALILGGVGVATLVAVPGAAGQRRNTAAATSWTGSWATAPTPGTKLFTADCTVRQVVHLSLGGIEPRLRLTNEYGDEPVHLGEVWTGRRAGGPDSTAMRAGTVRPVTFDGRTGVVVPAGGNLISDPVPDLPVASGDDLVITFYLPESVRAGTLSPNSYQRNQVVPGNVAALPDGFGGAVITRYVLLGGVSVRPAVPSAAVVAFGDSITCGAGSTIGANRRWPDLLAARARTAGRPLGVLNAGIGGNRLLSGPEPPTDGGQAANYRGHVTVGPSGLRRFARDVLDQPGAGHVITLLGINDVGHGAGADALIAGHRRLIGQGRAAGLTMIGGTLLPFGGSGYDTPEHRAARDALNRWIRESGEYDAVVDFEAAVCDDRFPQRLWRGYDPGDHLHPNDAGMSALAAAVPLDLFSR
ncbi:Lysophospholipase L1 [Actinoplanes regularis]|uniref:Lysophospholipase L1 n=1 Tax=Actinoplanes regularis TaxID=52697 RepID=A0A239A363_9ACTN|nr:Lysophospholipase L1 [Actinoplanes regularis]